MHLWTSTTASLVFIGVAESSVAAWQQYIRGPLSSIVLPHKLFEIKGNVTNAESILNHDGAATLTRRTSIDTVPSITLDFGIDVVGFLQITFSGASGNQPGIRLTFSETTEYLTNVSDFTRSDNGDTITPGTDQFAVPAQPSTWTDTHGCLYNGTQVCADGLHGFRYVRIALDALDSDAPHTSPNGSVTISAVSLNYTAFVGTPDTFTGWFECSDRQLTQWWYDAAYTNDMNIDHFRATDVDPRDAASPTLEGKTVIFDGAKRDRDPYVGDLAVSGRTLYLTHDLADAARNVLADLADHQRADGWIPPASINNYTLPLFDYPLWWVATSWDYILYTGDVEYARSYFVNLQAVLDDWYPTVTDDSHLLSKGLNNTDSYGDYAFLPRNGEVTYYNALYVLALKSAAAWAAEVGQAGTQRRWTRRADRIALAVNEHLWDTAAGAYIDTSNITDTVRHPQDGNSLAIVAGVANSTFSESSLQYMSENLATFYGNAFYDKELPGVDNATQRVYAFISYFELEARFMTNKVASALDEISRLYGWMASQDPRVTMWEGIGPGGSKYEQGYTSCAHGWSTGILPILTNHVLGVTPTSLGFKTWMLKPKPGDLKWARGEVPTPHGGFTVSWTRSGRRNGFVLEFESPSESEGTVCVPMEGYHKLHMDDRFLSSRSLSFEEGFACITKVGGGHHEIQLR